MIEQDPDPTQPRRDCHVAGCPCRVIARSLVPPPRR
jgi:hypothetical protein